MPFSTPLGDWRLVSAWVVLMAAPWVVSRAGRGFGASFGDAAAVSFGALVSGVSVPGLAFLLTYSMWKTGLGILFLSFG